jgi:hypothetical protein
VGTSKGFLIVGTGVTAPITCSDSETPPAEAFGGVTQILLLLKRGSSNPFAHFGLCDQVRGLNGASGMQVVKCNRLLFLPHCRTAYNEDECNLE